MSKAAGNGQNERIRVIIVGAAGRDFHDFNVFWRNDPRYEVVAFTAAQIPDIDGRVYPPSCAVRGTPRASPSNRRRSCLS